MTLMLVQTPKTRSSTGIFLWPMIPYFFPLLPYRARLQPASAEQRMAFAASKAWIELGACGPDNPAVKASGADLLVSLLSGQTLATGT